MNVSGMNLQNANYSNAISAFTGNKKYASIAPLQYDSVSFSGSKAEKSHETKLKINKAKTDLKKAIKNNDAETIYNYFGMEAKKNKKGDITLKEYRQPDKDYTFDDVGINEQKIFKNVAKIEGDAVFENSEMSNLKNLKKIGGDANFRYSKITDLGKLKEIGGDACFSHSEIKSLKNLKKIYGAMNINNSKLTDLGNLEEIRGGIISSENALQRIVGLSNASDKNSYIGNSKLTPKDFEGIKIGYEREDFCFHRATINTDMPKPELPDYNDEYSTEVWTEEPTEDESYCEPEPDCDEDNPIVDRGEEDIYGKEMPNPAYDWELDPEPDYDDDCNTAVSTEPPAIDEPHWEEDPDYDDDCTAVSTEPPTEDEPYPEEDPDYDDDCRTESTEDNPDIDPYGDPIIDTEGTIAIEHPNDKDYEIGIEYPPEGDTVVGDPNKEYNIGIEYPELPDELTTAKADPYDKDYEIGIEYPEPEVEPTGEDCYPPEDPTTDD